MKRLITLAMSLILALSFVSAQNYGRCFGGGMFGFGWGMMVFMTLFGTAVIVAIILLIFWLIKQIKK